MDIQCHFGNIVFFSQSEAAKCIIYGIWILSIFMILNYPDRAMSFCLSLVTRCGKTHCKEEQNWERQEKSSRDVTAQPIG